MRRAATSGRALAALAGVAALLVWSLTALAAGEARPQPKRFTLAGQANGLYPGGVGRLTVTIKNPYRRHLRVRQIRIRVLDAGPACRALNLHVGRFRGFVDVRPRRRATVRLVARLAAKAPAGCSGARFPLRLTGKGSVW